MNCRRYLQAGATWCFPYGNQPMAEARRRYTPTGVLGATDGPYGPGVVLNDALDYITLTAAQERLLRFDSATQDFSIAAWVRRDATGASHFIFDKRDGGGDGWLFYFGDTDLLHFVLDADVAESVGTIEDTNWHHVAAVVDRSAIIRLYIDGVADGTVATTANAMATTALPRIGAQSYGVVANHYDGAIAGIVVAPRIWSPAEILGMARGQAF